MCGFCKKILTYTLVIALTIGGLSVSGSVFAAGYGSYYMQDDEPTASAMFADAVAVRPLTFVASLFGAAAWVVSLPFTLAGGNAGEAGDKLVIDPLRYTFWRPLGHMEEGAPPIRD